MEYLTMKDVAERLTVPYNVLRYHQKHGRLVPDISTGRVVMFTVDRFAEIETCPEIICYKRKRAREIEQMVNLCEGKRGAK